MLRIFLSSICSSAASCEGFLENAFFLTNLVADIVILRTRLSIVSCVKTAASFSRDALRSFMRTATRTLRSTK